MLSYKGKVRKHISKYNGRTSATRVFYGLRNMWKWVITGERLWQRPWPGPANTPTSFKRKEDLEC